MRCDRCHRPIKSPTKAIHTRGGQFLFGPKCARLAGLMNRERIKIVRARVNGTTWHDPAQMQLDLGLSV
jgi:hypothetical protein